MSDESPLPTCSECGHVTQSEKHLRSPRRRPVIMAVSVFGFVPLVFVAWMYVSSARVRSTMKTFESVGGTGVMNLVVGPDWFADRVPFTDRNHFATTRWLHLTDKSFEHDETSLNTAFDAINEIPHVRNLTVSIAGHSDLIVQRIRTLPPNIRMLSVEKLWINPDRLLAMSEHSTLQTLWFEDVGFTTLSSPPEWTASQDGRGEAGLGKAIASSPGFQSVESLRIRQVAGWSLVDIASLAGLSSLRTLQLFDDQNGDAVLDAIAKLQQVTSVDLPENSLSGATSNQLRLKRGPVKFGGIKLDRALAMQQDADSESAAQAARDLGFNDGPHIVLDGLGGADAYWVTAGEMKGKRFSPDKPIVLPDFAHLIGDALDLAAPAPPPAVWETPTKLLAISDVEGQYTDVLRFLTANDVVNDSGTWAFGDGHLVCVGDFVDRGTEVTEVLWLFHRLSREATEAGGHVHFILGNHEAMVLGGDVRYTDEKYKITERLLGRWLNGEDLLGANTVLGRWLRSCNSVERIGELVFVHAGLSPSVASDPIDFEALNTRVRSVLGTRKEDRDDIVDTGAWDLAWGRQGPLWYRGYFDAHAEQYGPVPDSAALDAILTNAGGVSIVIGHTKVQEVTPMFGGRVIAIDIPWTKPENVRGLVFDADGLGTVDIEGRREALKSGIESLDRGHRGGS